MVSRHIREAVKKYVKTIEEPMLGKINPSDIRRVDSDVEYLKENGYNVLRPTGTHYVAWLNQTGIERVIKKS